MPQFDPPIANRGVSRSTMANPAELVVGVDGYRDGWVAAALTDGQISWSIHEDLHAVLTAHPQARIGVDVPIGLPIDGERRVCDLAAREFLGRARSSIFFTPPRRILDLWRHDAKHPVGEGVARQTWNILPKIAEVDSMLARHPGRRRRVAEVHPECSFRAMAGATKSAPHPPGAFLASKKTGLGAGQRLWLLHSAGLTLPDLIDAPGPALDDLLDAAAAAWTAQRWRTRPDVLIRFGSPASGEILI
jgi:predicted RNase H-like nuclease